MACSSKEYAAYIAAKFSRLDVVSVRPMMGAYVLHMAGKVLGFIDGDVLLLEPGPTVDRLLPGAEKRELFPGSKLFVIVPDGISEGEICAIAEAIYDDLPVSKPRKSAKKAAPKDDPRFPFARHIKG